MANLEGTWDTVMKTPMGDQKAKMTFDVSGDTFTGSTATPMGTLELENGKIDGDTFTWTMEMTVPMKMTLEGTATVDGDTFSGEVKAGMMGTSAINGTRA